MTGMLAALLEASIVPDFVVGTSIGAANAAFAGDPNSRRARALSALWRREMHLDLTEEAVARLQGEFEKDIAAYDKIHDAIGELANALAAGIVTYFPGKFA